MTTQRIARFTCDRCGRVIETASDWRAASEGLPEEWGTLQGTVAGMSFTYELCDECINTFRQSRKLTDDVPTALQPSPPDPW